MYLFLRQTFKKIEIFLVEEVRMKIEREIEELKLTLC